jgi:hypothetical protein
MGAQNVVYSVLAGGADSMFVVGVTGFVGRDKFRVGIKEYEPNLQHYSNILRRHEPISNFIFLRILLKASLIDGDEEFRNIFSLSCSSYCDLLDKEYGEYPLRKLAGFGF